MTSYSGRHADMYDMLYAEKDYSGESAVVSGLLRRFGDGESRSILELACGTGSHALCLSRLGYDVVASDYSEDMLRVARIKGERDGSSTRFVHQDMRRIARPEKPFDAVICLFDSIGYVRTNSAVAEVLAGVNQALRHGGLFVFEFWHAAAMLKSFEPVRVRRIPTPRGELVRISETCLDPATQLATVSYDLIELGTDGSFFRLREVQVNRFFQLQEMCQFLNYAGLRLEAAFSEFSDRELIDENTWHVVAVARKC